MNLECPPPSPQGAGCPNRAVGLGGGESIKNCLPECGESGAEGEGQGRQAASSLRAASVEGCRPAKAAVAAPPEASATCTHCLTVADMDMTLTGSTFQRALCRWLS